MQKEIEQLQGQIRTTIHALEALSMELENIKPVQPEDRVRRILDETFKDIGEVMGSYTR